MTPPTPHAPSPSPASDRLRTVAPVPSALLRAADDPTTSDYHNQEARDRFDRLAAGLDRRFARACDVDPRAQDASLHGTVGIPPRPP